MKERAAYHLRRRKVKKKEKKGGVLGGVHDRRKGDIRNKKRFIYTQVRWEKKKRTGAGAFGPFLRERDSPSPSTVRRAYEIIKGRGESGEVVTLEKEKRRPFFRSFKGEDVS